MTPYRKPYAYWINNAATSTQDHTGKIYNPATGEVATVQLARGHHRAGHLCRRRPRFPLARHLAGTAPAIMFNFRQLLTGRRASWPRSSPPSTARCWTTPSVKWPASLEVVELCATRRIC